MTAETQTISNKNIRADARNSTFKRIARYVGLRILTLLLTVMAGIYLTILIANMGGYVDNIMRSQIRENVVQKMLYNKSFQMLNTEERKSLIDAKCALEEKRLGLNTPFIIRSFRYLKNAMILDLGNANYMTSDGGSRQVRLILLERLPATLLLMGVSQTVLFLLSVYFALSLSRKYGNFWDKLIIALSPTSSAPPWFYGIFLILIFAAVLKILPFSGLVDTPPPATQIGYFLSLLKHLVLPTFSLIISGLFLSIYTWRTFFLIYSSEDYVEMAKAKGVTPRNIERRYIMRPTMPNIVTSFALTLIYVWTGATITETVFIWPGLGRTLYQAIGFYDIPVIVGDTIVFAYLLVITVFLLDIVYVFIDPRVKVGG
jgi:peptide/nickel transport system permease protein